MSVPEDSDTSLEEEEYSSRFSPSFESALGELGAASARSSSRKSSSSFAELFCSPSTLNPGGGDAIKMATHNFNLFFNYTKKEALAHTPGADVFASAFLARRCMATGRIMRMSRTKVLYSQEANRMSM
jgi:hypothetical protein